MSSMKSERVTTMSSTTEGTPTTSDIERIRPVVVASVVGTIIEWYDFFIYGTAAALVFGQVFFPSSSPMAGTLAAFATYAVGFVIRPLGGFVFGHFGDRLGRKTILVTTLLIMGVTTTAIGLIPSYDQIGIAAPILLIVLRMAQGFGAGAEFAGAAILAVEYSPPNRRGFFGSWPQIGVAIGLASASAIFALAQLLPKEQFLSWGWRVPFVASIIVLLVGAWIRLRINELPIFEEVQKEHKVARAPVAEVLKTHLKSFLVVLGMRFADNAVLYIPVTFSLAYLKAQGHLDSNTGLIGVFIAAIVQTVMIPFFGASSDRIGRRIVYGGGALVAGLLMVPFFMMLELGQSLAHLASDRVGRWRSLFSDGRQSAGVFLGVVPPSGALQRCSWWSRAGRNFRRLYSPARDRVACHLLQRNGSCRADHRDVRDHGSRSCLVGGDARPTVRRRSCCRCANPVIQAGTQLLWLSDWPHYNFDLPSVDLGSPFFLNWALD